MIWQGNVQEVVEFYATCDYKYHPKPGETIVVAMIKNQIVGIVRLSEEENILHFRGMQIHEDQQRKGYGTKMLKFVSRLIGNRECFLVGYPYLKDFYGQVGFIEVTPEDVPQLIKDRYNNASQRFPDTKFNIMVVNQKA